MLRWIGVCFCIRLRLVRKPRLLVVCRRRTRPRVRLMVGLGLMRLVFDTMISHCSSIEDDILVPRYKTSSVSLCGRASYGDFSSVPDLACGITCRV